jgi:parallel beta-helix repeat protein
MGLYLAMPNYSDYDITNSLFTGNKIFDCKGNGNNVFAWGGAENYSSERGELTGTVIEDNQIYGSHRSGIEIAGSADDLTIRNNKIYGNSGLPTDDPTNLKYGNGILVIRMGSDKSSPTGEGPENLTITGNEIYDNEKNGIYLGPINSNHTIQGNVIRDNGWDGIRIDLEEQYYGGTWPVYDRTSNILAHCNSIYDNGMGAQVIGTPTNGFVLDAEDNWWGDASGPLDDSDDTATGGLYNPTGLGNAVSDNVDYKPWESSTPPCQPTAICLASFNAEAGMGSVTLAWETATETDNAGFNLYRASAEDGPYIKVNSALVAAEGDPVSGASYSFLDKGLESGTYYYKLEDVDLNGVTTLHGPVSATVLPRLRRPSYRPTLP